MSSFFKAVVLLAVTSHCLAGDLVFESANHRTALLELYTSEGCSSCPSAEAWFSKLKENPRLWRDFVPVAFHVDYWDGLGWPDRFASKAFTERQRNLAASWGSGSVYTPGFVLNAREWQGGEPPVSSQAGGILRGTLGTGRELAIQYNPGVNSKRWVAHVATLGFGLESNVRAGENSGRVLRHDFIVLSLVSQPLEIGSNETTLKLSKPVEGEKALALWVTEANALAPIQATGGWLQ